MAKKDVVVKGYTADVAAWLDWRFRLGLNNNVYMAHEPIYGFMHAASEPDHFYRYARLFAILEKVNCLEFSSFADIGGAEGFISYLIRELFSVEGINADLSTEACIRGQEIFGIPGAAVSALCLPFADCSFDLVLCCEVIEHLEDPIAAIRELDRIAKKCLIITTDHVSVSETERMLKLLVRDPDQTHGERNFFTPDDFKILLGDNLQCYAQIHVSDRDFSITDPRDAMREILKRSSFKVFDGNSYGIVVVKIKEGSMGKGRWRRKHLLRRIFAERVPWDYPRILEQRNADGITSIPFLRCPSCLGALKSEDDQLLCQRCELRFPIISGVPRMYLVSEESEPQKNDEPAIAQLRHKLDMRNIVDSSEQEALARQCIRLLELQKRGSFPYPWETKKMESFFSDPGRLAVLQHLFLQEGDVTGHIDMPGFGETVRGAYKIKGWAIDRFGVKVVEIEVDGEVVGKALYGGERLDIAEKYPRFEDSLHSAFEMEYDFSLLSPGGHKIKAIVVNRVGSKRVAATQFFKVP